ncbi:FixH family protein, partial [Klebsiella pneumoniae]|uniref:FixH family protein n=1 Tax=Klebsiella pneumoniae TaxID=573 RepID=UPI003A96CB9B
NLISPTQQDKDRKVPLTRTEQGRYVGQLDDEVQGRRFVELLGSQDEHVWRLFEEEKVEHGVTLQLGDEALQGAEHQ